MKNSTSVSIFRVHLSRLFLVVLTLFWAGLRPALANEPNEAVKCTNLPKSSWIGEQRIRQIFEENKYIRVFLKVSRGNCYEFYAIGKDNSITEAYYDPISAELMQSTFMAVDGKVTTYERPASKVQPVKRGNQKTSAQSASSP